MTQSEIASLHKSMVKRVYYTLKQNKQDIHMLRVRRREDIIWDDKRCRICAHQLVGKYENWITFEYAKDVKSDIQLDFETLIFAIPTESKFYYIDKKLMYDTVNHRMNMGDINYQITDTGDVLNNQGLCISIDFETFQNIEGMQTMDYVEMPSEEVMSRNKMALQYEPLVNKITKQFAKNVQCPWEDIKSMAWEGLVIAFNTYDANRSNMTFLQFAGFAIRNNILTSLNNELRTVKMSVYNQKKAEAAGEASFSSVSMSIVSGESNKVGADKDAASREYKYGLYENATWDCGDVYEYLYNRLDSQFNERDCQIFYMTFGLKGYEDMKGKEIAKHMGISEGLVSQKLKKIISFIRKDNDLCEMLGNLQ